MQLNSSIKIQGGRGACLAQEVKHQTEFQLRSGSQAHDTKRWSQAPRSVWSLPGILLPTPSFCPSPHSHSLLLLSKINFKILKKNSGKETSLNYQCFLLGVCETFLLRYQQPLPISVGRKILNGKYNCHRHNYV